MQNASELKAAAPASESCSASGARVNRRTLYLTLALGGAAGLFLGWEWLVAIGASALLIALLPCLVMCAIGICAARMHKNKTAGAAQADAAGGGVPLAKRADDAPFTREAAAHGHVVQPASAHAAAHTRAPEAAAPTTTSPVRAPND